MRIRLTLIAIICLLSFISCNKSMDINTIDKISISNVNLDKISEVMTLPMTKVRLGYLTLSPEEKVIFWNNHLNDYENNHEISSKLKDHILDARRFLTPEIYKGIGTPSIDSAIAKFTKDWLIDPVESKQFNLKELLAISSFNNIGTKEETLSKLESTSMLNTVESDCNCFYTIYCTGAYGSSYQCITKSTCQDVGPATCGVFGGSKCTGHCE